jgi:flavodoxin
MKKIFTIILGCLLVTSLGACNSTDEQDNTSNPQEVKEESNLSDSDKILVVYFSMPETTDPNNMSQEEENSAIVIDGEVLGNTQYVAQVIHENTDSEFFRLEPSVPYPTDHDTLVDQAANEQDENYRPEIKDTIQDFDQYDTIFVGYPNWWGDMPMILYSFFDDYDFSNKTIVPFNTHGGSGFSNTIDTITELEPNATVITDGFTVSRNSVDDSEDDIFQWLKNLGIK